jgi:predicted type IV restriction endonuclease
MAFLDTIKSEKRMQYTAALNAMAALVSSDIDVRNVHKIAFTRGESRRLIMDISFCDSYPTEIASIDFKLGNIPQIPFRSIRQGPKR